MPLQNSSHLQSSGPLYKAVEDYITDLINNGELVAGDLVPPEPQLAKTLNVSQGTIKKALDNLVWAQLLYRHQGKGTYVSPIDFNNSLFRFTTYGDQKGKPTRLHKTTITRELTTPSQPVKKELALSSTAKTLHLERIGYHGDVPVMMESSYWNAKLVKGLEDPELHIPDLLYALIVEKFGLPIIRAEETLTANVADQRTAKLLKIKTGDPVLTLHRKTYTSNNKIVEIRTSQGRADMFSYKTEIR